MRWNVWVYRAVGTAGIACGSLLSGQAGPAVAVSLVDENGAAVASAQIEVEQANRPVQRVSTDFAGHASYRPAETGAYSLRIQKNGFYEKVVAEEGGEHDLHLTLNHVQMVTEQVNVSASTPGIDPQQVSDKFTMAVPEIVNVPYPTSRDIRNLLGFFPGVVQDGTGQVHLAGSETWATLDLLDGFDVRSPVSGNLAMRVSSDAVRSIDEETTRYPVEFGRATGGVVALFTGMGDNKFRFNATDFVPSFHNVNGIRFDKFVPRITFTGPVVRDRAWFFDGLELEYDNIYIQELPENANTNHLSRGSNLLRFQVNTTPHDIVSAGLLYNLYHSQYEGISSLVPRESTVDRNTIAWLPYVREQHTFARGALLDAGIGWTRFRDGYDPQGSSAFEITPEQSVGSYFEGLTSHSHRLEGNAALYLPAHRWLGAHDVKLGLDLDRIEFDQKVLRAPIRYLREDRTLLRESTFPSLTRFTRHNVESGAYVEDRWTPRAGWLLEPGLRFDWDEVIRRPLFSPRLAVVYSPVKAAGKTKISAGVGIYYEHTQLEYLERALAGTRFDTDYAADGVTPLGPATETTFTFQPGGLHEARAVNWSVGIEQRLPGAVYVKANLMQKRITDLFTYTDQSSAAGQAGNFVLTNGREDHDRMAEIEARRTFRGAYTLFAAYTHAAAHTNAAIQYEPTLGILGPQQAGPLPWDVPNRLISWGWLPFLVPGFSKQWDFVYTADWRSGFPYTAINADQQVVGAAGGHRFPNFVSFSPGLEWRFHFRGAYFGLRGVMENATQSGDYGVVNNNVDSPQFGQLTEPMGRAITARIRLIQSKK